VFFLTFLDLFFFVFVFFFLPGLALRRQLFRRNKLASRLTKTKPSPRCSKEFEVEVKVVAASWLLPAAQVAAKEVASCRGAAAGYNLQSVCGIKSVNQDAPPLGGQICLCLLTGYANLYYSCTYSSINAAFLGILPNCRSHTLITAQNHLTIGVYVSYQII